MSNAMRWLLLTAVVMLAAIVGPASPAWAAGACTG